MRASTAGGTRTARSSNSRTSSTSRGNVPPASNPPSARRLPIDQAFKGDYARAIRAVEGRADEAATWLRAYVDCAQGRFATAARRASLVARSANDPAVRHRALITLGSARRQQHRYAEARAADEAALRHARTREERAHALIGLAADHVGIGDTRGCSSALGRAARAAPGGDWRVHIRLSWVRAECALAAGEPAEAVRWSVEALGCARVARAARHIAKSSLFLGVSLDAAGRPGADRALRDAQRLASKLGARPIARVASQILARRARERAG